MQQQQIARRKSGLGNGIIFLYNMVSGIPHQQNVVLGVFGLRGTRLMPSFDTKDERRASGGCLLLAVGARSTFLQQHQHKKNNRISFIYHYLICSNLILSYIRHNMLYCGYFRHRRAMKMKRATVQVRILQPCEQGSYLSFLAGQLEHIRCVYDQKTTGMAAKLTI